MKRGSKEKGKKCRGLKQNKARPKAVLRPGKIIDMLGVQEL